jgi:predicted ATPase
VRDQGSLAADTPVPETIQAVLAARIDRLPLEAKHLLYTAAVIGPEVPVPLLAAIAELPPDVLHRRLDHLQAAEFLSATHLAPAPAYTFKHVLTHEVAYGSLVQERRRTLHSRLVDVLEALSGDQVADQLDRLAYHALHGERWDKALAYSRQAGAMAFSQSAYQEAVAYFEQARAVLVHLPSDRPTMEQAIELYCNLGAPLLQLKRLEQRLTYLRTAEALAHELADQHRLARVYNDLAATLLNMQELESALAYCQDGLAMAIACGDRGLQGGLQSTIWECSSTTWGTTVRPWTTCSRH